MRFADKVFGGFLGYVRQKRAQTGFKLAQLRKYQDIVALGKSLFDGLAQPTVAGHDDEQSIGARLDPPVQLIESFQYQCVAEAFLVLLGFLEWRLPRDGAANHFMPIDAGRIQLDVSELVVLDLPGYPSFDGAAELVLGDVEILVQ